MIGTNQEQVNQFKNLNQEQQAEQIADICNRNGITLDQLKTIYNGLRWEIILDRKEELWQEVV